MPAFFTISVVKQSDTEKKRVRSYSIVATLAGILSLSTFEAQ